MCKNSGSETLAKIIEGILFCYLYVLFFLGKVSEEQSGAALFRTGKPHTLTSTFRSVHMRLPYY
jgi:hypothetical protein